MTPKN